MRQEQLELIENWKVKLKAGLDPTTLSFGEMGKMAGLRALLVAIAEVEYARGKDDGRFPEMGG